MNREARASKGDLAKRSRGEERHGETEDLGFHGLGFGWFIGDLERLICCAPLGKTPGIAETLTHLQIQEPG